MDEAEWSEIRQFARFLTKVRKKRQVDDNLEEKDRLVLLNRILVIVLHWQSCWGQCLS